MEIARRSDALLGVGMYSVPEAARLTGMLTSRVRRWLRGYNYPTSQGGAFSEPVFVSDLTERDGRYTISFLDLVELRVVKAFLDAGVRWPLLRRASHIGQAEFNVRHPFALRRFETDGRRILQVATDGSVHDIETGQGLLPQLAHHVFKSLDFGVDGEASRWWPAGRGLPIALDPDYYLGAPILTTSCVPTRVISNAYRANKKDAGVVSDWLGVTVEEVNAAVEFENSLAA